MGPPLESHDEGCLQEHQPQHVSPAQVYAEIVRQGSKELVLVDVVCFGESDADLDLAHPGGV